MAKGGANTKGCNCSHSDAHNERRKEEKEAAEKKMRLQLDNPNTSIRAELTQNNSSWKAHDVPSLWRLDQDIRKDYAQTLRKVKMKDGTVHTCFRELPSKGKTAATPVKETVLLLPTNGQETDAMVTSFAKKVEELTGWRCIRWYVHRDERYDDPDTGEQRFNCHAHVVWDCYDWNNHQIRSVGKAVMRQIQDIAAEVTGMERGTDARITHAEHLSVSEFKNAQERQKAELLKAQNLALQQEVADLRREIIFDLQDTNEKLKYTGNNLVIQFDKLSKKVTPTEKQIADRDALVREVKSPKNTTHKELIKQNRTLHVYIDLTASAVHDLTAMIIKKAASAQRALAAATRKTKLLKFLVPKADVKEIATIEEMQALVNQANADRDKANADRDIAITYKRNAIERQIEYQKKYDEAFRQKTQLEWEKKMKQEDLNTIADKLTRLNPDIVLTLENIGIPNDVGQNTWTKAKKKNQELQKQAQRPQIKQQSVITHKR